MPTKTSRRTKRASSRKPKNKFFNFNIGTAFVYDDYVNIELFALPAPTLKSNGQIVWKLTCWLDPAEGKNFPAVQGSLLLAPSKKKSQDDDDDDDDDE